MSANNEFRRNVLRVLRAQFRLEWLGIHGVPHWARVRWNALAMARVNGARAAEFTLQLNSNLLESTQGGRMSRRKKPEIVLDAQGRAWDLDDFFLDSHGVEAPEADVFELFAELGYPPHQVNKEVSERYRA